MNCNALCSSMSTLHNEDTCGWNAATASATPVEATPSANSRQPLLWSSLPHRGSGTCGTRRGTRPALWSTNAPRNAAACRHRQAWLLVPSLLGNSSHDVFSVLGRSVWR